MAVLKEFEMEPVQVAITGNESEYPATPNGALSEFYRAFNNRNLDLMRQNWHHAECVLDNPLGGIRRGWVEIEPLYDRIFSGPAKVQVAFFDYTIHLGEDMFCAAGRERGIFEKGDMRLELAIRTSRIYRLVGSRWKQIHHHGSIEDSGQLAQYQQAVFS